MNYYKKKYSYLISQPPGYPEMLRVTVDGGIEIAHGQIYGPHVADLSRFLQPVAHLLDQLHALLVGRQGIGIVSDGGVDVSQGRQGRRRRLSVL